MQFIHKTTGVVISEAEFRKTEHLAGFISYFPQIITPESIVDTAYSIYIEPTVAADPAVLENIRISRLWQTAHDYEFSAISGSAVGLLTIGVMQAKPKCLAVQNWIRGIWTEYYTRKGGVSDNTDYSVCGACPYSVPELMAELGL